MKLLRQFAPAAAAARSAGFLRGLASVFRLGLVIWPLAGATGILSAANPGQPANPAEVREIVVTNDLTLPRRAQLPARIMIRASNVTLEGNEATLTGPGRIGDPKSLETAGVGIVIEGVTNVTVKNVRVHGFATGLVLRRSSEITVSFCDFSDNYHNPKHGWGELPPRGGILVADSHHCVFRRNRANRVWDAFHLIGSDDNQITDNDFSDCSNTCAKLWRACRNKFLQNNLSYGIRIDRAAKEVHARDSTCVLIETGSDNNYWFRNNITHGGDGVFIRPLNRWVSRGNTFVENDTSYANNNCVESWSPGNVFIRNKANHGSYGFWMGGSDQTVLIGNEAAFNGRPNGYHNAPEAGFGHGGIVIVGGSASHTLIEDNDLHDNNGAGLAFRGDSASQGRAWRISHWIVQRNRMANNTFGIWGRWGEAILLAGNEFTNNAQSNFIEDVSFLTRLPTEPAVRTAPTAGLTGPEMVLVGQSARFDANRSRGAEGRPLSYQWWLDGKAGDGPVLQCTFPAPGFYRLGLTVHDGALAGLAWRDVLAVQPVAQELGTEGQAAAWGFELEGNENGKGRMTFTNESRGVVGGQCLRFTPDPYPGMYATAIYPGTRDAGWNFAGKTQIRFWIRTQNPNTAGWQNAGPVIRLLGRTGQIELKPVKDANLLNDPPFSEARWLWMPMTIPLAGDAQWQRATQGQVTLERIEAISLSLDSWGGDPFTVWLDGLTVE